MTTDQRITAPAFRRRKSKQGPPLVVLTAYDAVTAEIADSAGVDAILIGDSLANVVLGLEDTMRVGMDEMLHHARAVGRARRRALLIADMPWMSYHVDVRETVRNAARFVREAGADAVKLEGGAERLPAIRALLEAEIPVMGHLGLTPQSVRRMGGYRVQGRSESAADRIVEDATRLAASGVFAIVLEGVPAALARRVTEAIDVPTIGIGAGVECDGQVLVFHDLLGMSAEAPPKFVRRYAAIRDTQLEAIRRWADDVRERRFPAADETYG